MNLLITQLSPPLISPSLYENLPQHPAQKTLTSFSDRNMSDEVSHACVTTDNA
jgi:hypothetical protein